MIPRLRAPYSLREFSAAALFGEGDCARFEAEFARAFDFPHALFFPYARSALFSLLQCLGWRERQIVVPAYVCAVVPHAVKLSGNDVVFADSARDHFLVPPHELERAVRKTTAMVVQVPLFGYPIDRPGGEAVLVRAAPDAFVLYDVAQGFGVTDAEGLQTSRANAALFSLGIGKVLTSLYGGVLCLRDAELHRELKAWRDKNFTERGGGRQFSLLLYGMAIWAAFREPMASVVDILERRTNLFASFTDYYYALDRPRIPDDVTTMPTQLQARVGLAQLARYDALISEREIVSQFYDDRLRAEGFATFAYRSQPTWSLYPLAVAERGAVVTAMRGRGVQLGVLNNFSCADLPGYESQAGSCPHATHWGRSMINLPNWPGLGLARAGRVIDALMRCRDERPQFFAAEISAPAGRLPNAHRETEFTKA